MSNPATIIVKIDGMGTITAELNGIGRTFLLGSFGHVHLQKGETISLLGQVPGYGSS
jgi:hypothetical protein